MNENFGNSGQLPPDAGSGGDARAQFEDWAHDNAFATNRDYAGFYLSEDTYGAWLAWQHLAARQPVGEPEAVVSQETYNDNGTSDIIKPALPIGTALYTAPPAPAAVPVDGCQDAAIVEAAKLAYGLLWMGTDLTGPDLAHRARVALRDALGKQACGEGINAARATHPQPAAAAGDA
ncbi:MULTISPECIES: hypothetical protein [Xanthomonas]|uniref:Uncharacterized protein n=2 Tax=Xanthomonas citri TaxID=346 RepID=A0AB33CGI7_XANCI|nr:MULTISPECIES: hypothetical protein [Xanthomonas]MBV6780910.1 hypothetical protein [Xanthomonas campestris pv. trichodesmae]ASK91831.1 hypothetical protein XcvCFBP7111P_10225 [Xanthomonas citri pv. vignicola]MBV6788434.1 hypothetical protein [Xanthomonas campestris pv. clerodendri]MBZ3919249.1 hypothetical protein [Xanthomonas campestris pv. trichodesmae]MBZ3922870.1 hypothetical protein [Xanthomonas citri pv. sesbaniae]